jgi:low affinity Fe/Cu permease
MTVSLPFHRSARNASAFERFAGRAIAAAGHSHAFGVACGLVVLWMLAGPLFSFSETWQLVINTTTTIVTFLMVFLLQQTQNKDSIALHLKLNELLASHLDASNRVIAIERLGEEDLRVLRKFYAHLAELAEKEDGLKRTHSLDEAGESHARKRARRGHAGAG